MIKFFELIECVCKFLELKESPELSNPLKDDYKGREGFIIYQFSSSTTITCQDGSDTQTRTILGPVIDNINEPMTMQREFTTSIAELALAYTDVVFNYDIVTNDQDANVDRNPTKQAFTCTIITKDVPFCVSSCVTTYGAVPPYTASNTARIQVSPPPAETLDYERENFYEITLQISDEPAADIYGGFNTITTSLLISIDDLDDQDPLFTCNCMSYTAEVNETDFTGIISVKPPIVAVDQDTMKEVIAYELVEDIQNHTCFHHLSIDTNSGNVSVVKPFDRENHGDECEVVVKAYQRFNPVRFSTAPLVINIIDINDHCPTFGKDKYSGIISVEDLYVMSTETGQERLAINVTDEDVALPFDGEFTYDYGDATGIFKATEELIMPGNNTKEIYIMLSSPGSLDMSKIYSIKASVTDDTITCETGRHYQTTIDIKPKDLSPIFQPAVYNVSIPEGTKAGTIVITVSATTHDGEEGIMYLLINATKNGTEFFTVNDENGKVTVISEITDAVRTPEYILFVEAQDRRSQPTRTRHTVVTISVTDTNNQCPEFTKKNYTGEISASDLYAVELGTLTQLFIVAIDTDLFYATTQHFIMQTGNLASSFLKVLPLALIEDERQFGSGEQR
ncbi:protocadherin-15-like [Amphiura filiformis]|uniref:protocadherin-15-like n=1 Tax=Amphiura filiformis TaxID=82378 RepID=UPI003B215785